jgi:hypothetical protein
VLADGKRSRLGQMLPGVDESGHVRRLEKVLDPRIGGAADWLLVARDPDVMGASERLPRPRNEVSALAVGPAGLGARGCIRRSQGSKYPMVRSPVGGRWVRQAGGTVRSEVSGLRGRDLQIRSHLRPVPGTVSHAGNPPGDFIRLRIRRSGRSRHFLTSPDRSRDECERNVRHVGAGVARRRAAPRWPLRRTMPSTADCVVHRI